MLHNDVNQGTFTYKPHHVITEVSLHKTSIQSQFKPPTSGIHSGAVSGLARLSIRGESTEVTGKRLGTQLFNTFFFPNIILRREISGDRQTRKDTKTRT